MRTLKISDMHHGQIRDHLVEKKQYWLARAADADRTMPDKKVGDMHRREAENVHELILLLDSATVS